MNDASRQAAVIVDEDIPQSEWVNFHPLENTASTTLRSADLLKFIEALGYQPIIADCGVPR
jgi:Ala-tRNA(Pro) deacylase